ncbi:MAG: amidohydrolase family protein [Oscillospiraceae bacterium]|jgi:2,3-dihydroxybenzoate decarboxylase
MYKIAIEEHFATDNMLRDMRAWEEHLDFPMIMGEKFVTTKLPLSNMPFEKHRLPEMDRNGIDMQIISAMWPAAQGYEDPVRAVAMAKEYNDDAAALVAKYPGRFRSFATLPLQDPEAALEELRRCVEELGFVGVMIQGHSNFEYLDNMKFDRIWGKLEEYDLPLYLHVGHPAKDQIKAYGEYTEMLGPCWNWAAEGTTHALRLVFGGVFERHPKAKFILGHLGETIPYLLRRFDEGADKTDALSRGRITREPSFYLKRNLYVSTSGEYNPEALRCAISALGIEHVMFACDYPLSGMDIGVECVENSGLTDYEKEMIYYRNTQRVFKLT